MFVFGDNEAQGHSSSTKLGLLPCGVGCVYCCAFRNTMMDIIIKEIAVPHQKVTGFAPKGYRGRNKRLEGRTKRLQGLHQKG